MYQTLGRVAGLVASLEVLVICDSTAVGASSTQRDDWAQFRGPNRAGRATSTGLLDRWPDGGPKLLWSVQGVGKGFTHVAVVGGLVYVTGLEGKDGVLRAYTLEGNLKWQANYGP